jgi:iron complex outermembrane receptor protein
VAFRTEALYNQRQSEQRFATFPITLFTTNIAPGQEFNPFTQALRRIQFRPDEEYARRIQQDVDTWHFAAGFEGELALFDRNWSWDVSYSYSDNEQNDTRRNLPNAQSLIAALQPDCTAGNGCVPVDVFHGPDAFTPEMADAVLFDAHDASQHELWDYSANLTGILFDLPAGPLAFTGGYEHRREQGFFLPTRSTTDLRRDIPVHATADPWQLRPGRVVRRIRSAPAEGHGVRQAPRSRLRGAQIELLDLRQHHRPEAGFRWKPTSELLVRGAWAKGFRAPSLSELYEDNYNDQPSILDVCAESIVTKLGPDVQARCRNGIGGIPGIPTPFEPYDTQIASSAETRIWSRNAAFTRTLGSRL